MWNARFTRMQKTSCLMPRGGIPVPCMPSRELAPGRIPGTVTALDLFAFDPVHGIVVRYLTLAARPTTPWRRPVHSLQHLQQLALLVAAQALHPVKELKCNVA